MAVTSLIGNRDPRVSDYRKVWIEDGETCVVGVYGPGTTLEITANWNSPFEGESAGSKSPFVGGVIQSGILKDTAQGLGYEGDSTLGEGMTLITTMNSRQVWEGNRPTSVSLELKLYALEDPDIEVMQPLAALERMIAPDTQAGAVETIKNIAPGRIPDEVQLNLGRRTIYKGMVIESMSLPYDKEVDSKGRFVRATVTLQLSTRSLVSKDMLKSVDYGIK